MSLSGFLTGSSLPIYKKYSGAFFLKLLNLASSTQFSSTIDFSGGICSKDFLLAPNIN